MWGIVISWHSLLGVLPSFWVLPSMFRMLNHSLPKWVNDIVGFICKSLTYNWCGIVGIYQLGYIKHLGSIISYSDEIKYMVYAFPTFGG